MIDAISLFGALAIGLGAYIAGWNVKRISSEAPGPKIYPFSDIIMNKSACIYCLRISEVGVGPGAPAFCHAEWGKKPCMVLKKHLHVYCRSCQGDWIMEVACEPKDDSIKEEIYREIEMALERGPTLDTQPNTKVKIP